MSLCPIFSAFLYVYYSYRFLTKEEAVNKKTQLHMHEDVSLSPHHLCDRPGMAAPTDCNIDQKIPGFATFLRNFILSKNPFSKAVVRISYRLLGVLSPPHIYIYTHMYIYYTYMGAHNTNTQYTYKNLQRKIHSVWKKKNMFFKQ